MDNTFYKISEISEELQYSKTYIYKIINENKQELKQYIKKVKGITVVSEEGFKLVKELLKPKEEIKKETDYKEKYIESLENEVEYLREQLQREQQIRMVESQNVLQLKEHFESIDEKLTSWREREPATDPGSGQGIFKRIFSRK